MPNPKETITEGILSHISKVLKRAGEKGFQRKLAAIEKSGPEGKKAVAQVRKRAAAFEKDVETINKLNQKFNLT